MWLVYLISVILGGGILLLQVLSGGGHDHDAIGHHGVGADHAHGPGLLSTRSAVYALFTFGFVGGCLHIPGLLSPLAALAVATFSAAAAALVVGYTFHVLGHPSASGAAGFEEARGKRARVLVPCAAERRGKIRVALKGQYVDMMATSGGEEIPAGTEVVVLEVRDDVAHVAPAGGRP